MAVLVAVGIVVVASLAGGGGDGPNADRVAQLQAQEQKRFGEQVQELSELAGTLHDTLLPVLVGMNEALPDAGSPPASSADPASWRTIIEDSVAKFGDSPSGSTTTNMARNGLRLSVQLLASSLSAYESALVAEGDQRQRLQALAVELRTQAVQAWSIAATQLDLLNVEAGRGHVHIYLSTNPDAHHDQGHG